MKQKTLIFKLIAISLLTCFFNIKDAIAFKRFESAKSSNIACDVSEFLFLPPSAFPLKVTIVGDIDTDLNKGFSPEKYDEESVKEIVKRSFDKWISLNPSLSVDLSFISSKDSKETSKALSESDLIVEIAKPGTDNYQIISKLADASGNTSRKDIKGAAKTDSRCGEILKTKIVLNSVDFCWPRKIENYPVSALIYGCEESFYFEKRKEDENIDKVFFLSDDQGKEYLVRRAYEKLILTDYDEKNPYSSKEEKSFMLDSMMLGSKVSDKADALLLFGLPTGNNFQIYSPEKGLKTQFYPSAIDSSIILDLEFGQLDEHYFASLNGGRLIYFKSDSDPSSVSYQEIFDDSSAIITTAHTADIIAIRYDSFSNQLVSIDNEGTIKWWDVKDPSMIHLRKKFKNSLFNDIIQIEIGENADHLFLLNSTNTLRIFDFSSSSPKNTGYNNVSKFFLSPDRQRLIHTNTDIEKFGTQAYLCDISSLSSKLSNSNKLCKDFVISGLDKRYSLAPAKNMSAGTTTDTAMDYAEYITSVHFSKSKKKLVFLGASGAILVRSIENLALKERDFTRKPADLEHVLMHEIGHAFGLDHPDDFNGAVMNTRFTTGETGPRELQPDDREGFLTIYPKNSIGSPCKDGQCREGLDCIEDPIEKKKYCTRKCKISEENCSAGYKCTPLSLVSAAKLKQYNSETENYCLLWGRNYRPCDNGNQCLTGSFCKPNSKIEPENGAIAANCRPSCDSNQDCDINGMSCLTQETDKGEQIDFCHFSSSTGEPCSVSNENDASCEENNACLTLSSGADNSSFKCYKECNSGASCKSNENCIDGYCIYNPLGANKSSGGGGCDMISEAREKENSLIFTISFTALLFALLIINRKKSY